MGWRTSLPGGKNATLQAAIKAERELLAATRVMKRPGRRLGGDAAGRALGGLLSDVGLALVLAAIIFVLGAGWYFGIRLLGYQSDVLALKHFAAVAGCDVSRALGLPAVHMDDKGYWRHNDRDGDGWACEPPASTHTAAGWGRPSAVAQAAGPQAPGAQTRDVATGEQDGGLVQEAVLLDPATLEPLAPSVAQRSE
jgi:hypothetical protein